MSGGRGIEYDKGHQVNNSFEKQRDAAADYDDLLMSIENIFIYDKNNKIVRICKTNEEDNNNFYKKTNKITELEAT